MYTELEVLNFLLSQVGAAPVSTTANPLPDLASAQLRLHEAMVGIQKHGWWFNRLYFQSISPDETTGEIDLPPNTLKIISSWPTHLIVKEGKAFDPLNNTYEFTQDQTIDLVLYLDWEDIPASAQDAVMYRAGKHMVLHELEDHHKAARIEQDEGQAFVQLKKEDLEIRQRNSFFTPAVVTTRGRVRPYKRYGSGSYNPIFPGGGMR